MGFDAEDQEADASGRADDALGKAARLIDIVLVLFDEKRADVEEDEPGRKSDEEIGIEEEGDGPKPNPILIKAREIVSDSGEGEGHQREDDDQ